MPKGFFPSAVRSSQLTRDSVPKGTGNPPSFRNSWFVLVSQPAEVRYVRSSERSLGIGGERSTEVSGTGLPPRVVILLMFTKVGGEDAMLITRWGEERVVGGRKGAKYSLGLI